jgi:hypothetical protein
MATFSKRLLSGSTDGKAIKVVQTATAGTTIHTAVSGTSDIDEIWLYAVNSSASAVKLTLEWGEAMHLMAISNCLLLLSRVWCCSLLVCCCRTRLLLKRSLRLRM